MSLITNWPDFPHAGVGRIRRIDAFRWLFGRMQLDVDEVRTHHFPEMLLEEMRTWQNPITPAETLWLTVWIEQYLPGTQAMFLSALMELINGEQHQVPLRDYTTRVA